MTPPPQGDSVGPPGSVDSLDLAGVDRVVLLDLPEERWRGVRDLLDAAAAAGVPTAVVPADGAADELVHRLVAELGDARHTILVAPLAEDGRPERATPSRAAGVAARRTGARLWQHPAGPGSGTETFVVREPDALPDDTLEDLHASEGEPWGAESRWYEERKRELLLAALPRARFTSGLEVGCSTGVLAEAIAGRCDRLLAVDRSPTALATARQRLAHLSGAAVAQLDVPREWPDEPPFDLVVVSEVGYFLSPAALDRLVGRVGDSLTPDGVVVLCHWRHPVEGWVMDAEEVHRRFTSAALPPVQATYRDRDVEIRVQASAEVWPDPSR